MHRGVTLFFDFWLIAHIADRIHSNECFGVDFIDIVHQQPVFLLVNDSDHLPTGCVVICTNDLVECSAAVEVVENKVNDGIQLVGNDTNPSFDVYTENKMIKHHAAEI